MDIMLRFQCEDCRKSFVVDDADVDQDILTCPFCQADVPVPDPEDDD